MYEGARKKTRRAITRAFWEIYQEKDISEITVKEISERAHVHRATFYAYYKNEHDLLHSIEEEQIQKFKEVTETYTDRDDNYQAYFAALQKLYKDNAMILKPLLENYREGEFAVRFRAVLGEKLRKDIGWPEYDHNSREGLMMASVLNGLIETFMFCLECDMLSLEHIYQYFTQSIHIGIAPAMQNVFGISLNTERKED